MPASTHSSAAASPPPKGKAQSRRTEMCSGVWRRHVKSLLPCKGMSRTQGTQPVSKIKNETHGKGEEEQNRNAKTKHKHI